MQKFVILTENGADLPQSYIDSHDIVSLPFHIIFDEIDHLDCDIKTEDLSDYYNRTGKVPSTAAVSPEQYQRAYEAIWEKCPEAVIIHIGYTSKASCAYQNALIADEYVANKVYHIDSLNVSAGMGFIVMKAVDLITENPDISPEELVQKVEAYVPKTKFSFVPGNLDFLRAGGRVTNAQYIGASLLRLKPLIEIRDGILIAAKKYRGNSKVMAEKMISDCFEKFNIDKKEVCLVASKEVGNDIRTIMENCAKKFGANKIIWFETGCTITTHAGPGGIGIAAVTAE